MLEGTLCFSQNKNLTDLISELTDAKESAVELVKEIKFSSPKRGDLLLLKHNYIGAKNAYGGWADEAADAVKSNKNINLKSVKAKAAKTSLNSLGDFGQECTQRREKEAKSQQAVSSFGPAEKIKSAAVFVKNNWTIIVQVANWWKHHREEEAKKREDYAKQILLSADWPDFNTIAPE